MPFGREVSVALPAPLRPILVLSIAEGMPTRSPCFTSKETSLRAQNSSVAGGGLRAGTRYSPHTTRHIFDPIGQHIAQGGVAFARLVAEGIGFAQVFDFDYGIRHRVMGYELRVTNYESVATCIRCCLLATRVIGATWFLLSTTVGRGWQLGRGVLC